MKPLLLIASLLFPSCITVLDYKTPDTELRIVAIGGQVSIPLKEGTVENQTRAVDIGVTALAAGVKLLFP